MTRRLLTAVVAATTVVAVAGCGSGETTTVTVAGPAGDITGAPAAAPEPVETVSDGRVYRDVKVGQPGRDGGITFVVRGMRPVGSVPRGEFSDGPLRPVAGAKLFVADVEYRNDGKEGVLPFCGSSSAVLVDEADRNFTPVDSMTEFVGNDELCDQVQPGFRGRVTLAFEVPRAARVATLVLWDDREPGDDFDARSVVRVSR